MTTRNAPAFPLPWKDLSPATEPMRAHVRERNLAYAVHAVNAYPKLIAALRACTDQSADAAYEAVTLLVGENP